MLVLRFWLTWFLAMLIPAGIVGCLVYMQIDIYREKRGALKRIRQAGKDLK